MKILGIIPARGGSKGIPGKNIKILNGIPLLQYTSDIALKSNLLSKVILSSDDEDIISVAKTLHIEVPFIRPSELAQDGSPTLSLIQHALNFYKETYNETYDAVCLLQVTTPFRTLDFLNKAIKKFIASGCDSLISTQTIPHAYNPYWAFVEDENGNLKLSTGSDDIIARRQDLPKAFHRDGSLYLTKVESILDKNSIYGDSVAYIESDSNSYVNIDTVKDWVKAEELAKKMFN